MATKRGSHELIAIGLAAGLPLTEVAASAGISLRTLRRRQSDLAVIEAIAAARHEILREGAGRLASLRTSAMDQLARLLECPDPSIRLRAIRLALEQALAL